MPTTPRKRKNQHSSTSKTLAAMAIAGPALMMSAFGVGSYYTEDQGLSIGVRPDGYFRNDDRSFGPYSLGFELSYFGQTYDRFFLNNNGNVSFGSGFGVYTPEPLDTTAIAPAIAPYWADVDTRPENGGEVLFYVNDQIPNQIIVTWDQVGYFSGNTDRLASFQLVLRGDLYDVPVGEGQIGFFYKDVEWETGDASGGSGGFGGVPATVGFGDGLGEINPGEFSLPGSQQDGISQLVSGQRFWFNLSNEGNPEGSTEDNPVLPEEIGPGGTLIFREVPSGLWYDPPFTSEIQYTITSPGDVFAEIMNFPSAFSDIWVEADGVTYGPYNNGDNLVFPTPVTEFRIFDLHPEVDLQNPLAFPLQIRFGDASASFSMSLPSTPAVPEAGTWVAAGGLAGVLALGWRRSRVRN